MTTAICACAPSSNNDKKTNSTNSIPGPAGKFDGGQTNFNCASLSIPSTPKGDWYLGKDGNSSIEIHTSVSISQYSTDIIVMCKTATQNIVAKVTVKSSLTQNSLSLDEDGEKVVTQGGGDCRVSVKQSKFQYTYNGGCLKMKDLSTGDEITLYPTKP